MITKKYKIEKIDTKICLEEMDEIVLNCIDELKKSEIGDDLFLEIKLPNEPYQDCYNIYDYMSDKIEESIKRIPNIKEILIGGKFIKSSRIIKVKFNSYEKHELIKLIYKIKKLFNKHIEVMYMGADEIK